MADLKEKDKEFESKIDTLIGAIKSKDLDDIIKKKVYIALLGGNKYTKEQLQEWLDKRITILEQFKKDGLDSTKDKKQSYIDKVSEEKQAEIEKIFSKEEFEPDEELIELMLYNFVTEG